MTNDFIDASPDPRATLRALQFMPLGWAIALTELTDNSIDKRARLIEFGWDSLYDFYFRDDGVGCPDLGWLIKIGEHHTEADLPTVGRYGIGLKQVLFWLAGIWDLESQTQDGSGWEASLDSSHIDLRQVPRPRKRQEPEPRPGLRIKISKAAHRRPEQQQLQTHLDSLSLTYSPALRTGLRMICRVAGKETKTIELHAPALPPFSESLSFEVHLASRTAKVVVGMVEEGAANIFYGFNYAFQYRVIKAKSALGCGRYSASRISGWVELVDEPSWADRDPHKWQLSTNKDGFVGDEELGEQIALLAESLLQKASEQPRYVNLEALSRRAEKLINPRLEAAETKVKGKRRPAENHDGTHSATGKGESPKQFNSRQTGNKVPGEMQQRRPGLRIEIVNFGDRKPGLGEVKLGEVAVFLNQHDRLIEEASLQNNDRFIANAALTLLFGELAGAQSKLIPSVLMPLLRGRESPDWFARRLSEYLLPEVE